ncbi:hypothetical protein PFISCL1PPCAC_10492, partial [Pristionchus fissidentatus]
SDCLNMAEDIALRIIRTTIFSLVVPNKEPCSTHKIRMEYKDMEGEEIPYGDYGHRNLDEFLLDHPMLNGMKQDGKWVFTAKISENSANIQALVRGQKSKKRKTKGGNSFARNNFSRNSYHGRPTLGQGDVRRANGTQPFSRTNNAYRSFNTGAARSFVPPPINSNLSHSNNSLSGSQQLGGRPGSSAGWVPTSSRFTSNFSSGAPIRPTQPRMGNQPRTIITPILNSSRVEQAGPQEGMRRFNLILAKTKGAATLRVFCRLYSQQFHVPFDHVELKRHFGTLNLSEIIDKYGEDKILVSQTPDGSVMFTDCEVLERHTNAARELEELKKNSVVIEPEKTHCAIPSLKKMFDDLTEMLVDSFPNGISLNDITSRYNEKANVIVDPNAVFLQSWSELIVGKFNGRMKIDGGMAVLTPNYIKANNLQIRASGERKKQELVTLSSLGIIYVEESSQEEDEDESMSETTSYMSEDIKTTKSSRNTTDWRSAPSGYNSMCSSVTSSVQCLNVSPREDTDYSPSMELDELTDKMRKVKMEVNDDSPRKVTVDCSPTTPSPSSSKRNLLTQMGGVGGSPIVEVKTPLPLGFSFGTPSAKQRQSKMSSSTVDSVSATELAHPKVTLVPPEFKVRATGGYTSFSMLMDSDEVYAYKVTCNSPYYRIFGSPGFTNARYHKMLQVMREDGPEGKTKISIDFMKKPVGYSGKPGEIMGSGPPNFTVEYTLNAL